MTNEERKVMIIPIGLELDRAIFGISKYNPDIIYVIYSRKEEENLIDKVDAESERFKELFVEKIRGLWKYEVLDTDVTNLSKCTDLLLEIFTKELQESEHCVFYINISTSSKIFSFSSFYLAGKYSENVLLFYVKPAEYLMVEFTNRFQDIISKLRNNEDVDSVYLTEIEQMIDSYTYHGWTSGPFRLIEIPYYKLSKYPEYEINLMEIMNDNKNEYPEGFTIENLLELNKEVQIRSNKIKLNYHLTELERQSLIENNPKNRKKHVKLQKSGEIFLDTIAKLLEN